MSTTAVVVTWNSAAEIQVCLDALVKQDEDNLRVVAVDNASTDGTEDVLRGFSEKVQLLRQPTNLGFAAANNLVAQLYPDDDLLLVNPDCVLDPGCYHALRAYLDAHPECGAAAAALFNTDGSPQCFARERPSLRSAWWCSTEIGSRADMHYLGSRHLQRRIYGAEMAQGVGHPIAVDTAAAACVLIRRSALPGALFDDRLPIFFNDTDMYERLRRDNWQVHVVPDATARHAYGTAVRRVPPERLKAEMVRSQVRYAGIWWPRRHRLALRLLFVADCLGCVLVLVLGRRRGTALASLRGTLGGLGLPGGAAPWMVR